MRRVKHPRPSTRHCNILGSRASARPSLLGGGPRSGTGAAEQSPGNRSRFSDSRWYVLEVPVPRLPGTTERLQRALLPCSSSGGAMVKARLMCAKKLVLKWVSLRMFRQVVQIAFKHGGPTSIQACGHRLHVVDRSSQCTVVDEPLHRHLRLPVLRAVQWRALCGYRKWRLYVPALALVLMRRAHTHPAAPRRTARPVVLCVRERERPRATKPFTCVVWG